MTQSRCRVPVSEKLQASDVMMPEAEQLVRPWIQRKSHVIFKLSEYAIGWRGVERGKCVVQMVNERCDEFFFGGSDGER